jgi:hypothetical protein
MLEGMIFMQPYPRQLAGADTNDRLSRGITFIALLGVAALGLSIANTVARVQDRKRSND